MNEMTITDAQYVQGQSGDNTSIKATIDGELWSVPLVPGNRHYDAIMKAVEAGDLTIADAD